MKANNVASPAPPSFVRKKPCDVTLPSANTLVTVVSAAGVSPTPTFHFELPSRSVSPAELGDDAEARPESAVTSGAASSQGQSPPPPFDEAERRSQFARFRQEVNRRMHSLLRTQLLPSQPASPAPDTFSIGYAWPAYTAAAAAPIGVHLLPVTHHAYRSSLHPNAAINPFVRYAFGGRPSLTDSRPASPVIADKQSAQFAYELPNSSPIKYDCEPLTPTGKRAPWPSWTSGSPARAPTSNFRSSSHNLAPPTITALRSQSNGLYHSDELSTGSVSIRASGYCHFGVRLLFTLLKLALIVLLLLSCARLSTLFFSIPERIRLYVAVPGTGQRALKLRICFQLMFSFALLVQLIQLYGVMYERFCLSGTFGAIQSAILILMALDARAANETTSAVLWLIALVLSAAYVLLLREMKRRRREKRRRRAAAEATGSHASTPYHEWCAQERRRIREQMRAAGQLNAMGGVVGSDPIGLTNGPVGFGEQWYECADPEHESFDADLPEGQEVEEELLVEQVEQPVGGYTNARMSDTPDPAESNYCNLHFVNDELDEEQPNRDHLSKQLMQHFEQMKLMQTVHQQWSLQEDRHVIRLVDVKRCRSEDQLMTNELSHSFNRICREESVECQIDSDSSELTEEQMNSSSDEVFDDKPTRIRLEQLDVKQLEQVDRRRLIVNDRHLQDPPTSPLVRVDVDSHGDRKIS
jgi:hypothetical protein